MLDINIELPDEQAATLKRELRQIIDGDRYFPSQRIRTLRKILHKIKSEPEKPPLRNYEAPHAGATRDEMNQRSYCENR